MTTRQEFLTRNVIDVEVGVRPTTGLVNLIKNPNGENGAWGWITPPASAAPGSYLTGWEPPFTLTTLDYLEFSTTANSGVVAYFTSEPEPCTAGHYASAKIRLRETIAASNTVALKVEFLNAAGAVVGTSATAPGGTAGAPALTVLTTAATVAPVGTVAARIRLEANATVNGARLLRFDRAMLATATTSGAVTGYAYVAPYTWTDITGEGHEIVIDRAGLALGTMTLSMRSPTLDPALSATLRPGSPIRVMAIGTMFNGSLGDYPGAIFTGEIRHAAARYELHHINPNHRTLITVSAVDPNARLANLKQPEGVADISDLRYLLEGCSTPFSVYDNAPDAGLKGSQVPGAPVVVTRNDNASVLDQIALARDTVRGHAWVTRGGVLKAVSSALMDTTVRATLTDSTYRADPDIDYDTARIINVVTVKRLAVDSNGATVETLFGPFTDEPSVAQWGAHREEFTVAGIADANVPGYAAAILAANAQPQVSINRVTIPIKSLMDFRHGIADHDPPDTITDIYRRVHLDLYDRVSVSNSRAGLTQTLRIAGIKHRITPDKWLMDLTFATTGGVALPSPAPALAETATPTATAAGSVFVGTPGTGSVAIAFPSGRFSAAPIVSATCTVGGNVALIANIGSITATGCIAYLYGIGGAWTTGAISVMWHAQSTH